MGLGPFFATAPRLTSTSESRLQVSPFHSEHSSNALRQAIHEKSTRYCFDHSKISITTTNSSQSTTWTQQTPTGDNQITIHGKHQDIDMRRITV